ncbi:hypothetical protein C8R44DRAFT_749241 [Mycena epipterygia]|nr:hypothetical protein C8R44DRAFT_749241 [Mycena epipterygia]
MLPMLLMSLRIHQNKFYSVLMLKAEAFNPCKNFIQFPRCKEIENRGAEGGGWRMYWRNGGLHYLYWGMLHCSKPSGSRFTGEGSTKDWRPPALNPTTTKTESYALDCCTILPMLLTSLRIHRNGFYGVLMLRAGASNPGKNFIQFPRVSCKEIENREAEGGGWRMYWRVRLAVP